MKAVINSQMKDSHFVVDRDSLPSKEYKAELLKCSSYHYHFSKFVYNLTLEGNENRLNQPLIMWNQYTRSKVQAKSKVLVILEMANDVKMIKSQIDIGQDIYFFNMSTKQLYETYSINGKQVTNYFGSSTWNESKYLDDKAYFKESFERRRNNFHGIEFKGMVDIYAPNVVLPKDFAKIARYFSENETYDVTNLVSGTYIDLLHLMENKLNFTTKLYLRKDKVWGVPKEFPNGTIEYPGMVGNIIDESADFIWATIVRNVERNPYLDFLPTLNNFHGVIYLPKLQETSDWIVYFAPFTESLWIGITISGILMAISLCFIETVHCKKFVSCNIMCIIDFIIYFFVIFQKISSMFSALWWSFNSNFGLVLPSSSMMDRFMSYKGLKFTLMICGLIVWLSYNGYLFSYLSFKVYKYPFKDLESMKYTNYKYVLYIISRAP